MDDAYRLFIVLDHEYGEGVAALARRGPVWIVDSPVNDDALRKCARPADAFDVMRFSPAHDGSPDIDLLNNCLMAEIGHRNFHAGYPSFKILEVIGASLDHALIERLSQMRFTRFQATAEGFTAALGDAVPDEATALALAKSVLGSTFRTVDVVQYHFTVVLEEDAWSVHGTLSDDPNDAAQLRVRINKENGVPHDLWRSFSVANKSPIRAWWQRLKSGAPRS